MADELKKYYKFPLKTYDYDLSCMDAKWKNGIQLSR